MHTYASRKFSDRSGFALISTFFLLTLLTSLLAAYMLVTRVELATTKASRDSTTGLYSAEAGLNLRASEVREIFVGYNTPQGTSPSPINACEGTNIGEGDFICQTENFNGRDVVTYIVDHQPGVNPPMTRITQGLYQGLNAQDFTYTANSEARGPDGRIEAILQLRFTSRVVPLFQFAAFYDKDLEILPGPNMTLRGRVHTNGDLYLNSDATLSINGTSSAAGRIYRGRKNDSTCRGSSTRILDPNNTYQQLVSSCPSRTLVTTSNRPATLTERVQWGVQEVFVPEPEVLDAEPGQLYFDKADLRLALRVNGSNNPDVQNVLVPTAIEVRDSSNNPDWTMSQQLYNCTGDAALPGVRRNPFAGDNSQGVVGTSKAFYDNREGRTMRMLDVDMAELFNCLHSTNWFGTGKRLDDLSEGGLVLHFTVDGPQSGGVNSYGVRLRNGGTLQATVSGAPLVYGLTVVSDQPVYVQGHYNNSATRVRAAVLADTLNILSEAWWNSGGADFYDSRSTQVLNNRVATNTTQTFAVLAGTDTTGGIEGAGGQGGAYNGGLENYPRFHENWTGRTLTYRGSFVSLGTPRKRNGTWVYGGTRYTAPNRDWDYDTSFDNASNLPPLSPRFVYLKQELFVRDFEQ